VFAQVARHVGRPNFQAGHAGSIPVIRSQLKALCRYRYLMSVAFPIIRGDVQTTSLGCAPTLPRAPVFFQSLSTAAPDTVCPLDGVEVTALDSLPERRKRKLLIDQRCQGNQSCRSR
jgi:hypothetical protein